MIKLNFFKIGKLFTCLFFCFYFNLSAKAQTNTVDISSPNLSITFDKLSGSILSMKDKVNDFELLDQVGQTNSSIFEICFYSPSGNTIINSRAAKSFKVHANKSKPYSYQLIWSNFEAKPKDFQVVVDVTLDKSLVKASWELEVQGIKGSKIVQVHFPKIDYIKDMGKEELAIPDWIGALYKNPREHFAANEKSRLHYVYPGSLGMQFFTVYNPQKNGLIVSTEDPESYAKDYVIHYNNQGHMGFEIINYPPFTDNQNVYKVTYPISMQTFKGDWQDAAEIYGQWGRNQLWAKNARLNNGKIPSWVLDGSCWIWNRGRANNVIDPAINLRERLDKPVNILWHWWHGGSYDDSFPDYFPPRDGNSFIDKIKEGKSKDVNAIVYMNQLKWGNSMPSWENEKAYLWSTKNIKGESESHIYNIFTNKSLTYMCLATDFWKEKYAALVDSAINKYKVSGVYMDQACLSKICYDPTHNHEPGGGNYWIKHTRERDIMNRSVLVDPEQAAFGGEGSGEAWLPYIDAFLTLGVSKERYAGVKGAQTIPLFQAVYHEYGISFGNYSSLLTPPYDEMWPKEHAPSNAETLLDSKFNGQFLIEQARSFVWGMQPMIANYHSFLFKERKEEMDFFTRMVNVRSNALPYLLYGKYLKSLDLKVPSSPFYMSKLSIYAGQKEKVTTFENDYPTVYHGLWQSKDGSLGLALASIQSEETMNIKHTIYTKQYNLSNSGAIYKISDNERTKLGNYSQGKIVLDFNLLPMEVCVIEFVGN